MLVIVAVTTALRVVLDPLLIDRAVFLLFSLAVMLSAWYGGLIPGLLATVLGTIIGPYLFVWPRVTDWPLPELVAFVSLFAATGAGIALLAERMHAGRRSAEASASAAREAQQYVTDILESISDCFHALDSEFRIGYVNPATERVMNKPAQELVGKYLWDLYPSFRLPEVEQQFRKVMEERNAVTFEYHHERSERWFIVTASPARSGISVYFREITERKKSEHEREELIIQLQEALAHVKLLSGMLPICAACKKIRDPSGRWEQLEVYIRDHSEAEFSHGLCPACAEAFLTE